MFENSYEFFETAHSFFNKKFSFKKKIEWQLPENESFYCVPKNRTQIPKLRILRDNLNEVKSKLNDFPIEKWSVHTKTRNPSQGIIYKVRNSIQAEFVTQAFCKFYECVSAYDLVTNDCGPNLFSLHLCEAPGAFITALNHYIQLNFPKLNWDFVATTLNPYYEGNSIHSTILDDRFLFHTLKNWHFGVDFTGNIMDKKNMYSLKEYCDKKGPVHLITGDGSIDCLSNPENQEEYVSKLHIAELLASLLILAENGNLLIKMFTFFENSSLEILYILNCLFNEVHVFKPATSKQGNSEVYVIAKNYQKLMPPEILDKMISNYLDDNKCLLSISNIPDSFISQVIICAQYFAQMQINVIEQNIKYYNFPDKREYDRIRKLKEFLSDEYLVVYRMAKIPEDKKILFGVSVNNSNNLNVKVHSGSYTERKLVLEKDVKLANFCDKLKNFYDEIDERTTSPNTLKMSDLIEIDSKKFLMLTWGNPIQSVRSSKFMYVPLFKYFNELLDFLKQEQSPNRRLKLCKFIKNNNTLAVEMKYFKNCPVYNDFEKEVVREIVAFIKSQDYHKISEIYIENLLLMTQYLVGFFLFLGQFVFHQITLMNKNSVIQLRRIQGNGIEMLDKFVQHTAAELNQKNTLPKAIVGICDIKHLFQQDFYKNVVDFNNNLCLKFCSFFLSDECNITC